jgi:hypothetical protein
VHGKTATSTRGRKYNLDLLFSHQTYLLFFIVSQ